MFITLYFLVTGLPDSLRSVRDYFLSLDPTSLTVDLLKQHLLTTETSAVAVDAACGTPRTLFFEGCSPTHLAPSYAFAAAVDALGAEDIGAASASGKHRNSKGKGGRGAGGGSGGGGGSSSGGGGGSGGGGSSGNGGGSGGGSSVRASPRRPSSFVSGCFSVGRLGHRCFSRLDDAWRAEFGDEVERPHWSELLRYGVAIFDLDYDAIFSAIYALFASAKSDPGIEAAALGAGGSFLPGTAPAEALHTFTLDSGASRCFFCDSTTLTPLPSPVPVRLADPSRGPVVARSSTVLPFLAVPSGSLSGVHLPLFSTNLVAASCSYHLLLHQTLLWHHRLGHLSLPRLRGMHSRLLISGLPRSLPPLPPSPAPLCLPCVKGRQRPAPHSSFPPTTAPLQTLHMDVWGPARVNRQGRERYFLLVVDDYTWYTTVFPLRSKARPRLGQQQGRALMSDDEPAMGGDGPATSGERQGRNKAAAGQGRICQLEKSLYGIKEALRLWQQHLHARLIRIGFLQLPHDQGMYRLTKGTDYILLIVYVDDLLYIGSTDAITTCFEGELQRDLTFTVATTVTQYLGLNMQDGNNAIYLSAEKYTDTIAKCFRLTATVIATPYHYTDENRKASALLKPAGIRDYQRKLGCLLFAAVTCRPDLSYSASQLATYLKKPEAEHMLEIDRALHYLVSTLTIGLTYHKTGTTTPKLIAVLMSASRHIAKSCAAENRAFLECKRADENPEKCLQQGAQVTGCVLNLLKSLQGQCPKSMDAYVKCMDYYSSEFSMCRKQQEKFLADCPL
ncbi:unnamed protein product [Closterium sp. NIES-54]